MSKTTGATCEVGSAYPSETHEITPMFDQLRVFVVTLDVAF